MIFGKDVIQASAPVASRLKRKPTSVSPRLQLECDVTPIVEGEFHSFRKLFSRRGSKNAHYLQPNWLDPA